MLLKAIIAKWIVLELQIPRATGHMLDIRLTYIVSQKSEPILHFNSKLLEKSNIVYKWQIRKQPNLATTESGVGSAVCTDAVIELDVIRRINNAKSAFAVLPRIRIYNNLKFQKLQTFISSCPRRILKQYVTHEESGGCTGLMSFWSESGSDSR